MELEKTTTFAGLVWVAGVLAMVLFQDTFAGSRQGIVLGLILVAMILVASYIILDGFWKIRHREVEQETLQNQALEEKIYELLQNSTTEDKMNELQKHREADEDRIYELLKQREADEDRIHELLQSGANEEKMYELLQSEIRQAEQTINDNTMRTAKLLVKYINKASLETIQKVEELEKEIHQI